MDGSGSSRAGAGLLPEVRGDPDVQAPLVSGRGEWAAYPFRDGAILGLGPNAGLGRFGPRGLFYILFVLPFSFSCFTNSSISLA
jgi:hypothetical protein